MTRAIIIAMLALWGASVTKSLADWRAEGVQHE